MERYIKLLGALLCAVCTRIFGGFDAVFTALLTFMAVDYITGVIAAAYNAELSSCAGYRGILKKLGILAAVAVAHVMGQILAIDTLRSLVIGFYLANEGLSIVENIGKTGVPLPKRLTDVLKQISSDE